MKTFIILSFVLIATSAAYAQVAAAYNKPPDVMTKTDIPTGASLFGVFEGRSPCLEVAKQLNVPKDPECIKMKWRLILYRDPSTLQPTTYSLSGTVFTDKTDAGKWTIIKGTPADPNAVVYQLNPGKPYSLYFLKGDDNVLFILDEHKNFRVGNADFSYTLNRVRLVPMKE